MEATQETTIQTPEVINKTPEDRLWERAEQLAELRTPLTELQMKLFEEVEHMRNRKLNLYEQQLLEGKEAEYWRVSEKVQGILGIEDQITTALGNADQGILDESTLQELAPEPQPQTPELSKKKQRIQEEKLRLGFDPREIDWELYNEFGYSGLGSPSTRVFTSGHNRKAVKGNMHPLNAGTTFFDQTVDTHGGKVSHGKHTGGYVTANGKRVRKI